MKKLFIVANWKSNKTISESLQWLQEMSQSQLTSSDAREIIVCPSFTVLSEMKKFISENNLPIKLGTQDISPFAEGAYTGAIAARQAAELVTHAIIGHSERRKYFHETDEDVIAEVKQLLANKITPILCVSDMQQMDYFLAHDPVIVDHADEIIFVYEPPSAISGGGAFHPETPEDANKNAAAISEKIGKRVITLYGGSVNPDSSATLFAQENIDGGLIGQASLKTDMFINIIKSFS